MLEPDLVGNSAGHSVCGKGERWQQAQALLNERWKAFEPKLVPATGRRRGQGPAMAKLEPCEKREAKLEPSVVLGDMWTAKLVPDFISYSAEIRACEVDRNSAARNGSGERACTAGSPGAEAALSASLRQFVGRATPDHE